MLLAISSSGRTLLGVLGVATLVIGFAAVIALAIYVIRRAPPDGSDVGRDPKRRSKAKSSRKIGAGALQWPSCSRKPGMSSLT